MGTLVSALPLLNHPRTANGHFAESNGGIQVHSRGGIGSKVLFQVLV